MIPLAERLEIVSHISYVDQAIAEVVPDKLETWESIRFNVLFKGDDWRGTAKGEKLERDFAQGGRRGRVLPVHHAHLEQHAPAGADVHGRRSRPGVRNRLTADPPLPVLARSFTRMGDIGRTDSAF